VTTAAPRAEAQATARAAPAAANTLQQSSFQPASSATQSTAGSWRGGPDTEIGRTIQTMMARMDQCQITIKGDTPSSLFSRAILDNRHVTNEQILAMANVKLEQLTDSPEDRAKVLKKIPNAQQLDSHKFTVAMLAAATGVDAQKLSELTPSLGMTGAPGTPVLYAPKTAAMQRGTAMHDFTDYLRGAGIQGLNKAVWGVENRILSALAMVAGRGRY
jgi:hypothetical protein